MTLSLTESLTHSLTNFYFWHYRVTLETCDLWNIWPEWWGNMTWPTFWNFLQISQVMSPHHSDQMSQRSQVSRVALFLSSSKVLSQWLNQWVTRSPIELFWTAKKTSLQALKLHQCATMTYRPTDLELIIKIRRSLRPSLLVLQLSWKRSWLAGSPDSLQLLPSPISLFHHQSHHRWS